MKHGNGRKLKAQLRLFFKDDKTASSISDALTPDNVRLAGGNENNTESEEQFTHYLCRNQRNVGA